MTTHILEWLQPIAVLDAGISRHVEGQAHGWCRYERQEQTKGSVIYHLFQPELGDVGRIELYMMAERITDMHLVQPSKSDVRTDDSKALAQRRREHHDAVIQYLLDRLGDDGITREGLAHPSSVLTTTQKPKPDEVIEKYYRAHAQNRRITLKQVCADMGAKYDSIRVAKVAYDKRKRKR